MEKTFRCAFFRSPRRLIGCFSLRRCLHVRPLLPAVVWSVRRIPDGRSVWRACAWLRGDAAGRVWAGMVAGVQKKSSRQCRCRELCCRFWRKGRDSNPRSLSAHRFSRPARSTTLPPFRVQKYDRFSIPPNILPAFLRVGFCGT